MQRGRSGSLAIVTIAIVLIAGYASSSQLSKSKPTKKDKSKSVTMSTAVPSDDPEHFLDRYHAFLLKDERRAIEGINKQLKRSKEDSSLVARRQELIDSFWARRDSDPDTPENEFKQIVDARIADIAEEKLFAISPNSGLLFGSNGGWRGDTAKVYLLHGIPDAASVLTGSQFDDLMLWLYMEESGKVRMAFMFSKKFGASGFRLFQQDMHQSDICSAVAEVARFVDKSSRGCTEDIISVVRDIERSTSSDGISGYVFLSALIHFSDYVELRQGKAMEPPEPAILTARKSDAKVVESPGAVQQDSGPEIVRASCSNCVTVIPATLDLEHMTILITRRNMDWVVQDEHLACNLKVDVIFESGQNGPLLFHQAVSVKTTPVYLRTEPDGIIAIAFLDPTVIPTGSYRVSVYVADKRTGRSNAWVSPYVAP